MIQELIFSYISSIVDESIEKFFNFSLKESSKYKNLPWMVCDCQ